MRIVFNQCHWSNRGKHSGCIMSYNPRASIDNHKPVPFKMVNGRYVRDNKSTPVEVRSQTKGNSLSRFPSRVAQIGYHKWS